jgi:uncharacterized membrane protein YccC
MKVSLDRFFPLYLRYGIKMGVACVMASAISYAIGSSYAVWAVVSAIIAMQINVAESLQVGLLRITGTVFGAVAGVLLLFTLPISPPVIMLALFCIALICGYLTRYTSIWSTTAVATVIVLFTGSQQIQFGDVKAISLGLTRLAEIVIGVGSAFLVSLLLWPVRLVDTLRMDISMQFQESARLVDVLLGAFISGEQQPYTLLNGIEGKIWNNHERLNKARKHESFLYHYEHKVMDIQVTAIDRTSESLRSMMEALNDYDEENVDPQISEELRVLGDAIMAALRHLGSGNPTEPAPDLVRGLTSGAGLVEAKLIRMRQDGRTKAFSLHKLLQIFAFYQAMRLLAESLLISMERIERSARRTKNVTPS